MPDSAALSDPPPIECRGRARDFWRRVNKEQISGRQQAFIDAFSAEWGTVQGNKDRKRLHRKLVAKFPISTFNQLNYRSVARRFGKDPTIVRTVELVGSNGGLQEWDSTVDDFTIEVLMAECVLKRADLGFESEIVAVVSTHALGRWYQRATTPDKLADAIGELSQVGLEKMRRVLEKMRRAIATGSAIEKQFRVDTVAGRWGCEVTSYGDRDLLILFARTFLG
jgi:hypothetical protein